MDKQLELLNKLAEMLHNNCHNYDVAYLEYKFNPDENWFHFSSWYVSNEKNYTPENYDNLKDCSFKLCAELHQEMLSHTEGDWRKFMLSLTRNGDVKTQFIYDIQSCMDIFK